MGLLVAEPAEVHHLEQRVGLRPPLALGTFESRSASSMLRRTVSHGNSADSWNISAGRPRFTETVPWVGESRPATMLSSVLLPQPDAPTRQTNSPGATSSDNRSRATTAFPAWP